MFQFFHKPLSPSCQQTDQQNAQQDQLHAPNHTDGNADHTPAEGDSQPFFEKRRRWPEKQRHQICRQKWKYKRQQVTETEIHARRDCCCEKCLFLFSAECHSPFPPSRFFLYAIHRYGSMISTAIHSNKRLFLKPTFPGTDNFFRMYGNEKPQETGVSSRFSRLLRSLL